METLKERFFVSDFRAVSGAGLSNAACVAAAWQSMPVTHSITMSETAQVTAVFLSQNDLASASHQMTENSERTNSNPRYLRMLQLAKLAWRNGNSKSAVNQSAIPLLLGLPMEPAHFPLAEQHDFLSWLNNDLAEDDSSSAEFDLNSSLVFPYGRASGLIALQAGLKLLQQGHHQAIWIGAVDTHNDHNILARLFERGRLATKEHEGSIAGEGAIFCLLTRSQQSPSNSIELLNVEYATQTSKVEMVEDAQQIALELLLQRLIYSMPIENQTIDWALPPCTGQASASEEWSIGCYGLYPYLNPQHKNLFPAYFCGDIGAADGLLKLLLCHELSDGLGVVVSHSDNLHRAAALVRSTKIREDTNA